MSAQLSFIICMSMGNAFQLPRGLVPRQSKPGGAHVGGKPASRSEAGQSVVRSEASRRGKRGAGIAGSRPLGPASLEPWATPPGAPNKHNGQSLAEPGGLAQGDGVMVLPRADWPRAPPPPPPTFGYKARGVGYRFPGKAHASCAVQLSGFGAVATTIFGCCARGVPSRTT